MNLSSILGSMTHHSTPGSPIYGYRVPAYSVSKAAVNAFTVQLAYELKDTKIKVNAAHPGWVKTDLGGEGAPMEIEDGMFVSILARLRRHRNGVLLALRLSRRFPEKPNERIGVDKKRPWYCVDRY